MLLSRVRLLILAMKFMPSPSLLESLMMLNILLAVRVWSHSLPGKSIIIYCDNQAVVSGLNSGKRHDMILAALANNICMETAMADIKIKLIHIMGSKRC